MHISEKQKFFETMKKQSAYYEKVLPMTVVEFYWDDLKNYSFAEIEKALAMHRVDRARGKYLPKVAELIDLIFEERRKHDRPANHATIQILKHPNQKLVDTLLEIDRAECKERGITGRQLYEERMHEFLGKVLVGKKS